MANCWLKIIQASSDIILLLSSDSFGFRWRHISFERNSKFERYFELAKRKFETYENSKIRNERLFELAIILYWINSSIYILLIIHGIGYILNII